MDVLVLNFRHIVSLVLVFFIFKVVMHILYYICTSLRFFTARFSGCFEMKSNYSGHLVPIMLIVSCQIAFDFQGCADERVTENF